MKYMYTASIMYFRQYHHYNSTCYTYIVLSCNVKATNNNFDMDNNIK